MATVLEDYSIRIYGSVTPYLELKDFPNPESFYPHPFTWEFTNARVGGCLDASIEYGSKSDTYLLSGIFETIRPGDFILIQMKCTGDSALKSRWFGMVTECYTPRGTNANHQASIKAVGIWKFLREYPLLTVLSSTTILNAFKSIRAEITHSHTLNSDGLITFDAAPSYTIATMDCVDTWADKALNALGTLAGPTAAWGVCPADSLNTIEMGYGQLYFAEVGTTGVDYGFEVGTNTVEDALEYYTNQHVINGALIIGQRKLAGGDLILWRKPTVGANEVWRIRRAMIPEAIDPEDIWRYGDQLVDSLEDNDHRVEFKALNFGRQPYANEIMNNPLKVKLENGGTATEIWPDKYTCVVKEDGSVDTTFQLGKHPHSSIAAMLPEAWRDVVVGQSQIFWSAAELAARDREVFRDWRSTAVSSGGMRNFWGAKLSDHESVVATGIDWSLTGLSKPSGWPEYRWEYDTDAQGVVSGEGDNDGFACSVFIPTGPADKPPYQAMVFAETGPRVFHQNDDIWVTQIWTAPNTPYIWPYYGDWWGLHPHLSGVASNAWEGTTTLSYKFSSGIPEQPLKIWLGRPNPEPYDTTTRNTYGLIKAATEITYVTFGQDTLASTCKAYALAIHRKKGSLTVYVALGWYENGGFHSDHWTAGPEPDATTAPSFTLGDIGDNDDPDFDTSILGHSLDLLVTLPDGTDTNYSVVISDHYSGTELYDSDDTHTTNTVDLTTPDAWVPTDCYMAGNIWKKAGGQGWDLNCFGLKSVTTAGGGSTTCAITRDGSVWKTGTTSTVLSLTGGTTWSGGEVGVRIALRMDATDLIVAWGVAFKTQDE